MADAKTFSNKEWDLVKNAAGWVFAAVSAADSRRMQSSLRNMRELRGYQEAVKEYESRSELVRAIIKDGGDNPTDMHNVPLDEALGNLAKINDLLKKKVDRAEGDDVRDFLMEIGQATAEAVSEKLLGRGDKVSEAEAAALDSVRKSLEATKEHKRARMDAALEKQKQEAARAEAQREREARADARERAKADADARNKALEEKREAAQRKARAEKNRADAAAKIEAARHALRKKEAAREESAQEAATAPASNRDYLAEYTVVSGDNLSFISERFYGTQAHWQKIYEANKEVIGDNPSLIRPGQALKIPKLN